MKKFLTASKDATIYRAYPNSNAGLDEILEIGKLINANVNVTSSTAYASGSARSLLYFDLPTTASVSPTANYFLNLRIANASNVIRNQEVLVYPVSRSWVEGSGYLYQNARNVEDGVSWVRLNGVTSWSNAGGDLITSSVSGSISLSTYPLPDLRIDVTNIVRPYVSQSIQNTFYGLAVQFPRADETSSINQGNIKVFSTQTHTIYQPTLEISWDNQTFNTGSLSGLSSLDVKIVPSNLKEAYTKGDVSRVSLVVRDQFPLKSFDSTLRYKNKYYLPTSSYYSIVDTQSNTTIVGFDDASKINTDTNGSYIVLDTNSLYTGRYYTLLFKVILGDYTRVISTDTLFKVN